MALLADFVCEIAVNPGTATTINLAGVASGSFKSWASSFTTGARVYYVISDEIGAREAGVGTFTTGSPNTLSRDTVLSNTSGTLARLNFAGTVFVYNSLPADKAVFLDQNGNINVSGLVGTANPGVGNVIMQAGDATHPGYVAFFNAAGTRQGYVGYANTGLTRLMLATEASMTGWEVFGQLQVDGLLTALAGAAISGNSFVAGTFATTVLGGHITSGGRLRAVTGAFNSGDNATATILSDFLNTFNSPAHIVRLPNGVIFQSMNGVVASGLDTFTFPIAFPTGCTTILPISQGDVLVSPIIFSVTTFSTTSFQARILRWNGTSYINAVGNGFRYLAIGY